MKNKISILSLFTCISIWSFGQLNNLTEIDDYSKQIDSLYKLGSLTTLEYDGMSYCGGTLIGYFIDTNLVFITSTYSAEAGYSSKDIYIKNNKPLKIRFHEHSAEWEKYSSKYPNGEGEYGSSYEHMTYTDTTYFIYVEQKTMKTFSKGQYINNKFNDYIYKTCLTCFKSMLLELKGKEEEALEILLRK